MKKSVISLVIVLCLLLCACSAGEVTAVEPSETEPVVTEDQQVEAPAEEQIDTYGGAVLR